MFIFAPLVALAALVAAQADPSIVLPAAVVQCQPVQIAWTASNMPVIISILPQVGATPLQDLGQQAGTSLTWIPTLPTGTLITFQIRDSENVVAFSAPVTVQHESSSNCLGAGTSASTAGDAATQTGSSPPVQTGDTGDGISWPTNSPNAAPSNVKVSLAGLLGLVAAIVVV